MAINPVIPNGLLNDPCNTATVKQLRSYEPAHLFLQWTTIEPYYTPLKKSFRGIDFECGYTTHYRQLHCVEQKEQGLTLYHTFVLGTFDPGTVIWYRLTTSCNVTDPISFSPPIKYIIPPCSAVGGFVKVQRVTNTGSSNPISCVFTSVVGGNPALFQAGTGKTIQGPAGHYQGYSFGRFRSTLNSPATAATWRISFNGFPGYYPNPFIDVSLLQNQAYDFVLNFDYQKTNAISTTIGVQAQRISGASAIGRFEASAGSPCVLTQIFTP